MDKPMPGEIFYTNPPVEIKGLMTLRDYFAAKALQALMTRDFVKDLDYKGFCDEAYRMADGMLKARMGKNT